MCRRPVVGGSRSKTSQRSGCAGHDAQPFGTRRVSPHEDATEGFAKILYSRRHSRSHMGLSENRGYPQIPILMGNMVIIHWNMRYTIFRQTHMNFNILFIRQCWVHTTALDIPADYDRWKHTDQHMYWSIAWHVSANKYTHCIMRSWANCHIVLIIMLIGPNVYTYAFLVLLFLVLARKSIYFGSCCQETPPSKKKVLVILLLKMVKHIQLEIYPSPSHFNYMFKANRWRTWWPPQTTFKSISWHWLCARF